MKKLQLFDQNHGLSPLQKCQLCLLFKSMFILSRKACFLTRTSPNNFSGFILHNTKRQQNFQFLTKTMDENHDHDQNHGPKPWLWLWLFDQNQNLWKNPIFVGFWNRCFCCSERLVCYKKDRKSFFHHLFSRSMTWEYRGLQGVTEGYKGLQGVTGGYKRLQGVKRGDRGWQGVTGGYKGL